MAIGDFYNDGYFGKCGSCGADGYWMETEDQNVISCECGHEEVLI